MSAMPAASGDYQRHLSLQAQVNSDWEKVKSSFVEEFGEARFKSWLQPLKFKEFFSGRIVIAVPTRFMRDWIQTNCAERMFEMLKAYNSSILALDLVVDSSEPPQAHPQDPSVSLSAPRVEEVSEGEKEIIGSRLDPRYAFDNFIVGKPNELAYAAARRVADATAVTFNPLFLYGGVGLGKTHLMHAIAWHIQETQPQRKVVYLSAEKFMYLFIKALRFRDTVAFK